MTRLRHTTVGDPVGSPTVGVTRGREGPPTVRQFLTMLWNSGTPKTSKRTFETLSE